MLAGPSLLGGSSMLCGGQVLGRGSDLDRGSVLGSVGSILLFFHGNGNSTRRKELNILFETALVQGMFLGVFAASCRVSYHCCHKVSSIAKRIFHYPTESLPAKLTKLDFEETKQVSSVGWISTVLGYGCSGLVHHFLGGKRSNPRPSFASKVSVMLRLPSARFRKRGSI